VGQADSDKICSGTPVAMATVRPPLRQHTPGSPSPTAPVSRRARWTMSGTIIIIIIRITDPMGSAASEPPTTLTAFGNKLDSFGSAAGARGNVAVGCVLPDAGMQSHAVDGAFGAVVQRGFPACKGGKTLSCGGRIEPPHACWVCGPPGARFGAPNGPHPLRHSPSHRVQYYAAAPARAASGANRRPQRGAG
jgi:hypothetical protein